MATYYIDFEGGNDTNTGLSFAQRWRTITVGATAARIAPGDEIRIMASPDPTSVGSATWTGGGRQALNTISSSSATTPIVITSAVNHSLVSGDYVIIDPVHSGNNNAIGVWMVGATTASTFEILQMDGSNTTSSSTGSGGRFVKATNMIVKTATPLVQNIALCGGVGQKPIWVNSSGVITTRNFSDFREGYSSIQIAIQFAFTTGKTSYYTLPTTLDLSGYQQVSFYVRQTAGSLASSGDTYLALCSDTLGNTVVHQCPVPAIEGSFRWIPVTVNLGVALSSTINSVALYQTVDRGAQTFQLDNIVACKAASAADSIALASLISKSDGTDNELWYPIQSLNSNAIMLANGPMNSTHASQLRGYYGTTETVTTYKRETVKTPQSGSASTSTVNASGSEGNPITFSGGWDRTDMSTQTGQTWLDGLTGSATGLSAFTRNYITVSKINLCRYNVGLSWSGTGLTVGSMYVAGSQGAGFNTSNTTSSSMNVGFLGVANANPTGVVIAGFGHVFGDLVTNGCFTGVQLTSARYTSIDTVVGGDENTSLLVVFCFNCTIGSLTAVGCLVGGGIVFSSSSSFSINGGSTTGCIRGISSASSSAGQLVLNNFTINEATEIFTGAVTAASVVYSNRHDNTDNNSYVFQGTDGVINQQSDVVDSPATTAWRMRPLTSAITVAAPLKLQLGTIVCAANSLVTVSARMRRDNTGLTMRLCCPGGQISGASTDVTSDLAGAADVWDTVTITFTPTKPGAVDIFAYAFGGTTFSGFVCNLSASQA